MNIQITFIHHIKYQIFVFRMQTVMHYQFPYKTFVSLFDAMINKLEKESKKKKIKYCITFSPTLCK